MVTRNLQEPEIMHHCVALPWDTKTGPLPRPTWCGSRRPGSLRDGVDGPATPGPTSSRGWSRPHGRRWGSGAGCRPGKPEAGPPARRREEPGEKKKAITAIAHTLLKIAYQVLKTGTKYQ